MNKPHATPTAPPPTPNPAAPAPLLSGAGAEPAGEPAVQAAQLASQVIRKIKDKEGKPPRVGKLLADWLHPDAATVVVRERCQRFLEEVTTNLVNRGPLEWLHFTASSPGPWFEWHESVACGTLLLSAPCRDGDGLFRVANPTADWPIRLLRKSNGDNADHRVYWVLVCAIVAGALSVLEGSDCDTAQAALHKILPELENAAKKNLQTIERKEGFCDRETYLNGPPAASWRASLRRLLAPNESAQGCGFLSADYEGRLFRLLPVAAATLLNSSDFVDLWAPVAELRDFALGDSPSPQETLGWLLERLRRLDRPSTKLAAVLSPGTTPPAHRRWLWQLLENFRQLAALARLALGERLASPTAPAAPAPPASPRLPPAATPAAEEPFARLCRQFPEQLGKLVALAQLTAETAECCRQNRWPDASVALGGLLTRSKQFLDSFAAGVEASPPAVAATVVHRALVLTDELINNLRELDCLLPGEDENGPLSDLGPADLTARLRDVRTALLRYLEQNGGYRVYALKIHDTGTKHGDRLEVQGFVPGSEVKQGNVAQILLPGYETVRPGHTELLHRPQVKLAQ